MSCHGLVGLPGSVTMVAGLQELLDVVFAALRDGVNPPVPERGRLSVGVPGGVGVEGGDGPGCPPVHELPRVLVLGRDRDQQPGVPGRGHRGGQAIRRVHRRPQFLGHVGLVAGVLLLGEPGVSQGDPAVFGALDRLLDGLLDTADTGGTLGGSWPLGWLADLEGQGCAVHRDPVDRRPDHELGGQRGCGQPVQQAGQEDVVDGQGDGFGQAGVQVAAGAG